MAAYITLLDCVCVLPCVADIVTLQRCVCNCNKETLLLLLLLMAIKLGSTNLRPAGDLRP